MEDDDEAQMVAPPAAPDAHLAKAIDRPGANTGIKGVLADYADAKHKMELLDRVQNQVAWLNVAELGMVSMTVQEQEDHERKMRELADNRPDTDEEDELDADEDEFMAQYRFVGGEGLKKSVFVVMHSCCQVEASRGNEGPTGCCNQGVVSPDVWHHVLVYGGSVDRVFGSC